MIMSEKITIDISRKEWHKLCQVCSYYLDNLEDDRHTGSMRVTITGDIVETKKLKPNAVKNNPQEIM